MQTAIRSHIRQLKTSAGVAVTYNRDSASVPITVVPARVDAEVDEYGQLVLSTKIQQDFLVEATDLGALGEPARGDYIDYRGYHWEVLPTASERCFHHSDAYGIVFRVHTTRTQPVP